MLSHGLRVWSDVVVAPALGLGQNRAEALGVKITIVDVPPPPRQGVDNPPMEGCGEAFRTGVGKKNERARHAPKFPKVRRARRKGASGGSISIKLVGARQGRVSVKA